MTAVERYEPTSSFELAPRAWDVANKIAGTAFVPKALRGDPSAVLACILTGHELQIGPMQSLAKIHVVDGRAGMSAELQRAVVLAAGHSIVIEESTNTRCTLIGKRLGGQHETRITWTMDDARQAGIDKKDNWRHYPRSMLVARATGELVRAVFPDVVAGLSYTTEELTDGGVVDLEDLGGAAAPPASGSQKPRRTAKAKKAVTPAPDVVEVAEDQVLVEGQVVDVEEAGSAAIDARRREIRELPPLPGEPIIVGEFPGEDSSGGSDEEQPEQPLAASPGAHPVETPIRPARSEVVEVAATPARTEPDEPAIENADEYARNQRAHAVARKARECGITTDDERHRFIAAATEGRAANGHQLTADDLQNVMVYLVRFKRGEVRVGERDGSPVIEDANFGWKAGPAVDTLAEQEQAEADAQPPLATEAAVGRWADTPDIATAPDRLPPMSDPSYWTRERWLQEARPVFGLGEGKLLKRARAISAQLGNAPDEQPLSLSEIPSDVAVLLRSWLAEQLAAEAAAQ